MVINNELRKSSLTSRAAHSCTTLVHCRYRCSFDRFEHFHLDCGVASNDTVLKRPVTMFNFCIAEIQDSDSIWLTSRYLTKFLWNWMDEQWWKDEWWVVAWIYREQKNDRWIFRSIKCSCYIVSNPILGGKNKNHKKMGKGDDSKGGRTCSVCWGPGFNAWDSMRPLSNMPGVATSTTGCSPKLNKEIQENFDEPGYMCLARCLAH